jgi:hypothetical protein
MVAKASVSGASSLGPSGATAVAVAAGATVWPEALLPVDRNAAAMMTSPHAPPQIEILIRLLTQ